MKIGVVLVTYNRLNLLKRTLYLYEEQLRKPDYILIVNNCSTDGTTEFLNNWEKKSSSFDRIVIHLDQNIGGSGGFNVGLDRAMKLQADWIWIADDDAFPEQHCLQILEKYARKFEGKNIAAICSKNMNGGQIDIGHRCRLGGKWVGRVFRPVPKKEYEKEYFYCDLFSYVGTAIRKEVLYKGGLPRREFFIYGDDFEHAIRIRQYGKIICVPQITVEHSSNGSKNNEVSWRDYYETRNHVWIHKQYFGMYSFRIRQFMRMYTAIKSRDKLKIAIFIEAIRDAKNDKLGIHEVYRPGWIPNKRKLK